MKSFRSKPVGWRGESYRHYLASKGVKTYRAAATERTGLGRIFQKTFDESDARRKRVLDPERLRESQRRSSLSEEASVITPTKEQIEDARAGLQQRSRAKTLLVAARDELGEDDLRNRLKAQAKKESLALEIKNAEGSASSDDGVRMGVLKTVFAKLNADVPIKTLVAKDIPNNRKFSPREMIELNVLLRNRLDENPAEADDLIRRVEGV